MKYFLVIAFVALASGFHLSSVEEKSWMEFKVQHKKTYANLHEEMKRKEIFASTLKEIEAFNAGDNSYEQGINQFSDMTHEEFLSHIGALSPPTNFSSTIGQYDLSPPTADSIDWRDKDGQNYVGEVRNQGGCGSCWSFSTLGSLEAIFLINKKVDEMTLLSEQHLVDCWKKDCEGAWMWDAMDYIKDNNGIVSEESYPYTSEDGNVKECGIDSNAIVGTLTGYKKVSKENDLIKAVSQVGPTCVTVCVPSSFSKYKKGVYDDKECNTQKSCQNLHAIVAVGYTKTHWIVKNSWGAGWGEKGYIRIAKGKNRCNIGSWAVYPTV